MDKEVIFTVEEAPEGGYTARALGYSIFTQAETFDGLRKLVVDARRGPLRRRGASEDRPASLC